MPTYSRFAFTNTYPDWKGRLTRNEREPFLYRDIYDNRVHVVTQGDTLETIASQMFSGLASPSQLWWIIADFQPDGPIVDPMRRLPTNKVLYVPSERAVIEEIMDESRRYE